jgi:hypothetical protein
MMVTRMPAPDRSNLRLEFDRGVISAMDPDNQHSVRGGPAVTNMRCWWLGLRCAECRHTFRPGDRVVVSVDGASVRHASPELPCGGDVAAADRLDPALVGEFFRGLSDVWRPPGDQVIVTLTSDHPLLVPPVGRFERRKCFVCGHTFRLMDRVIRCPCGSGQSDCLFALHCDPEHNRNCWQDWEGAGRRRFCPAIGAERK